jgi:hypothetical protein
MKPEQPPTSGFSHRSLAIAGALIAVAAVAGIVAPIDYFRQAGGVVPYYMTLLSWLLIAVSVSVLVWGAKSYSDKPVIIAGWLLGALSALTLVSWATSRMHLPPYWDYIYRVYPELVGLSSLVGMVFGLAVFRSRRVPWALIFVWWGLFGIVRFVAARFSLAGVQIYYLAGVQIYYGVVIIQMIVLLAVGILMYRDSRVPMN